MSLVLGKKYECRLARMENKRCPVRGLCVRKHINSSLILVQSWQSFIRIKCITLVRAERLHEDYRDADT